MNIRDLACWPPRWHGESGAPDLAGRGESGTLIAIRWDAKTRPRVPSIRVTMEIAGDRYSGVLEDEARLLAALYLHLGSYIGRPLATIGNLALQGTQ